MEQYKTKLNNYYIILCVINMFLYYFIFSTLKKNYNNRMFVPLMLFFFFLLIVYNILKKKNLKQKTFLILLAATTFCYIQKIDNLFVFILLNFIFFLYLTEIDICDYKELNESDLFKKDEIEIKNIKDLSYVKINENLKTKIIKDFEKNENNYFDKIKIKKDRLNFFDFLLCKKEKITYEIIHNTEKEIFKKFKIISIKNENYLLIKYRNLLFKISKKDIELLRNNNIPIITYNIEDFNCIFLKNEYLNVYKNIKIDFLQVISLKK